MPTGDCSNKGSPPQQLSYSAWEKEQDNVSAQLFLYCYIGGKLRSQDFVWSNFSIKYCFCKASVCACVCVCVLLWRPPSKYIPRTYFLKRYTWTTLQYLKLLEAGETQQFHLSRKGMFCPLQGYVASLGYNIRWWWCRGFNSYLLHSQGVAVDLWFESC